ncbi:hypothetical protein CWC12_02615 [Pseudoalteromonas ruthenica]|nr:hypothetical protein CWC12_02615 [Pseudoalteromonas ruthenica]TMO91707.1 hypothetical protein CWC13_13940 [Pseudoalteromonas ruthenica]TMO99244.1 hypothetical protein CWC07_09015 [Pseudoalteromonas ruthenica]TMP07795.1 hypothetical protein CWC08_13385 [Pseudoalteromonas ruthenica]TMP10753.1 hypothetical protein CWC09_04465 [Pseudoalteromonas ruthenica]
MHANKLLCIRESGLRDSVFKVVFLGKRKAISFYTWLKLLLLEIYLGEQLLEMLANTSSYNYESEEFIIGSDSNGWKRPLIDFIPSTMINKFLSERIINLLRIKYVQHYRLLKRVTSTSLEHSKGEQLYKLNNQKLHLITELKLAYNTIWVTLNIIIDVLVFWYTNDLTLTILVGGSIEFLRRLKW